MFDLNKLVRKNIKALKAYSSARSEYTASNGLFFDANENPFGQYNRYPDPLQKELKQTIIDCKKLPISEKQIFIGNGSDEAIDLLFRIFCNPAQDKALTFAPTYGMYKVSAGINDVELLELPLNENFDIEYTLIEPHLENEAIKLIFLCSPNNPTANVYDVASVEKIIQHFKGIVVIDEAYADFSAVSSFAKKINEYPNLVVMQTLSKAYGMANLRLGMAYANEAIIALFNKVKPPYNVSGANQKIAIQELKKTQQFQEQLNILQAEKQKMIKALETIKFVEKVYPSDTNFILLKVNDANTLYQKLVDANIIIRNRHNYIANTLRISVGTPAENKILLDTLKNI